MVDHLLSVGKVSDNSEKKLVYTYNILCVVNCGQNSCGSGLPENDDSFCFDEVIFRCYVLKGIAYPKLEDLGNGIFQVMGFPSLVDFPEISVCNATQLFFLGSKWKPIPGKCKFFNSRNYMTN